jgi:hypothetical protein
MFTKQIYGSIPSQIESIHILIHFLKICLNITFPSTLAFLSGLFPTGFRIFFCGFHVSPISFAFI